MTGHERQPQVAPEVVQIGHGKEFATEREVRH